MGSREGARDGWTAAETDRVAVACKTKGARIESQSHFESVDPLLHRMRATLWLLGLAATQALGASPWRSLFVAPTGKDAGDCASIAAPCATPWFAQSVVRGFARPLGGDVVVYLRGGTYYAAQTWNFTMADSGYVRRPGSARGSRGGIQRSPQDSRLRIPSSRGASTGPRARRFRTKATQVRRQ